MNDVRWSGHTAAIASLTGSPLWGLSIEEVLLKWTQMGLRITADFRPKTPYDSQGSIGPRTIFLETPSGRPILWIPSYGGIAGRDWLIDKTDYKVFWILLNAGVKVLIVGGTSGVADWREDEGKIVPGDMVLPWSFKTNSHHRGLPGTPYEIAWPFRDVLLDDPFCTELSKVMYDLAKPYVESGQLHAIHTSQDTRVALVVPEGITFETSFDILQLAATSKLISQLTPNDPPVVTLHGDCVNPVLARMLGIHMAYYHFVANVAQGMPMDRGIVDTLYELYVGNFAKVAIPLEVSLMQNLPIPNGQDCACISSVHEAPAVFAQAMTGG